MKYIIRQKVNRQLRVDNKPDGHKCTTLTANVEYYASRKGRIFGFLHSVGQEMCDMSGNTWISSERFIFKEDCKEFIKQFHYYHYGIGTNFEIIDKSND